MGGSRPAADRVPSARGTTRHHGDPRGGQDAPAFVILSAPPARPRRSSVPGSFLPRRPHPSRAHRTRRRPPPFRTTHPSPRSPRQPRQPRTTATFLGFVPLEPALAPQRGKLMMFVVPAFNEPRRRGRAGRRRDGRGGARGSRRTRRSRASASAMLTTKEQFLGSPPQSVLPTEHNDWELPWGRPLPVAGAGDLTRDRGDAGERRVPLERDGHWPFPAISR